MNKHAVGVVDLVLQAGGEQPFGVDFPRVALRIEVTHLHPRRPLHLLVIFRDRQAALLVGALFLRRPDHLRIDEDQRLLRLVLLGEVHGDDPQRHADLDRGEPDAGRVVHGLEHVLDQLADLVIHAFHLAQTRGAAWDRAI